MNKTVTINISGIIFNIDEEAYNKLNNYLETIKGYFSDSEGRDEIMADIEARIAEMFQEKLTDQKQVVSLKDVQEVIAVMGEPEDYLETEDEEQKEYKKRTRGTGTSKIKRLYRDPDDRILGGVCSGIGYYFNIDPIIPRILFVIAVFAGFSGLFIYLILWLIIPEAKTTAEKLQMKGESVTVENIKKAVQEEAENIKKKFKSMKDNANGHKGRDAGSRIGNFLETFFRFIGNLISLIFRFLGKLFGLIFVATGAMALISLIFALFGSVPLATVTFSDGMVSYQLGQLMEVFFSSPWLAYVGIIGFVLLSGIPFFMLMAGGLKMLLGSRVQLRNTGLVALSLWFIGLIATLFAAGSTATDFSNRGKVEQVIGLNQPGSGTMVVKVDENKLPVSKYNPHYRGWSGRQEFFQIVDDKMYIASPDLDIQKSETDSFQLVITKISRGHTYHDATERAEQINYKFTQQDSTITFDPTYWFGVDGNWRAQEVDIVLLVPEGKSVYLGESAGTIIHDIQNVSRTYDRNMLGYKWTMLSTGLTCIGCFEGWEGPQSKKKGDSGETR